MYITNSFDSVQLHGVLRNWEIIKYSLIKRARISDWETRLLLLSDDDFTSIASVRMNPRIENKIV